jgi:hypothetical protein
LCALPAAPESLTGQERRFLLQQFEQSAKTFLGSVRAVSEAQWKFKPAPDRWSIGECAEHVATTDEMLFVFVTAKVLKMAPPEKPAGRQSDEEVLAAGRSREKKTRTAEFLEPKGRFATRAAALEAFEKSRARVVEFVKTTEEDLRGHGVTTPTGFRDAYQLLLGLSAHAERHAQQIEEVKADPAYPTK